MGGEGGRGENSTDSYPPNVEEGVSEDSDQSRDLMTPIICEDSLKYMIHTKIG